MQNIIQSTDCSPKIRLLFSAKSYTICLQVYKYRPTRKSYGCRLFISVECIAVQTSKRGRYEAADMPTGKRRQF